MVTLSKIQQQLPTLFSLARERTEAARMELAGHLADILMDRTTVLSMREQELVNELIDTLLQSRTPSVRMYLVKKFTDNIANMPRKIAMTLAADQIDVAEKVLRDCLSFTDDDLIHLVQVQGRSHAEVIAQRKAIAEAVVDALVTTGDVKVMCELAKNLGARISPKAMDVMMVAARFSDTLCEPLIKRPELRAETGVKLFWWMKDDLRRYALQRFGLSAGQIDEALSDTINQLLEYHTMDKGNDEAMLHLADWLNERKAISARILPQVLRMGHFRLFNILLSRLTRLGLPLVDAIIAEAGGRGLAVVCRAIGVDKSSFVSLFLLSRGARADEQVVHPRELSQALQAYDRLTVMLAQDLLNSWKKDPSYFKAAETDVVLENL